MVCIVGKMAQDVRMMCKCCAWCHSHQVLLVYETSIHALVFLQKSFVTFFCCFFSFFFLYCCLGMVREKTLSTSQSTCFSSHHLPCAMIDTLTSSATCTCSVPQCLWLLCLPGTISRKERTEGEREGKERERREENRKEGREGEGMEGTRKDL